MPSWGTSFILHEPQLIESFFWVEKRGVILSDNDRLEDFILEVILSDNDRLEDFILEVVSDYDRLEDFILEVLLTDNDRMEDFILEVGSYSIEHNANNNIFSLIRKSN